jgi:AcrR family transcriptional regulator
MNEHKYIAEIAEQFVLTGYRGTTTALLAKRLGIRENVLYRVWPSKRDMFIASIRYIHEVTSASWQDYLARRPADTDPAQWLLQRQAQDHGQMRLYRIVYAGILEDDPEIHAAIRRVYSDFHQVITEILASRPAEHSSPLDPQTTAWTIMGLAAIVDIQRELELSPPAERRSLLEAGGDFLIKGNKPQ